MSTKGPLDGRIDASSRTTLTQVDAHAVTAVARGLSVASAVALLPAARTGLGTDCKAQAEQLRSVDVRRLVRRAGNLMSDLDDRIRTWLDL